MAFWDAQAEGYDTADMTNDNMGELDIVLEKCHEIRCSDIVTLGGAVGSRDPKVILEDMLAREVDVMPQVIFNDLSERQVSRAIDILKPMTDRGISIKYTSGEIADVCTDIGSASRRLILGVYHSDAFFKADPAAGFPLSGYDEYLKNHVILGEEFFVSWVSLMANNEFTTAGVCTHVRFDESAEQRHLIKSVLGSSRREMTCSGMSVAALQVIGLHSGKQGFFLSHWYTGNGILKLVRSAFPEDQFSINVSRCAKGMVLTIDPIGVELTGIITILNNVLGNVLPQGQHEALLAVRSIMS